MACNLNFNQCNSGCQFPRPIFNCRCRLLSILNSSEITVVNPQTTASLVLSTVVPQTVTGRGVIDSNISFISGNDISLSNGTFMLTEGSYLVSYAVSGTIASNGLFAVGLNQDGFLIEGSQSSSSGSAGGGASLTNSAIVTVTSVSSLVTLINTLDTALNVASGNITIQKLS